jgi:succinoglycan biosynthesis transport protein ExoP
MAEPLAQQDQILEDLQIGRYLDIFRRRKWHVISTATAIFMATFVVVLQMPAIFRAETVILVDPQKVPDSYVTSTINTTVSDRLSTVRQEVMSPTRLRQLLDDTGLYAKERAKGNEDRIIQRMQSSILLEVIDAGGSRASAFRIGYTGPTPEEAALVPNRLASLVINSKVEASQEQSSGTAEFLDSELQQTKKSLEQKEAEMSRIKSTYIMDLPESKQFHLEALTTLRAQLQNSQDRVNRAQQERIYLQSMTVAANPTVDLDANSPTAASSAEQAQVQKLEARLVELRGRYGAGHPDVRKVQKGLDQLEAKIAEQQKNAPAPAQVEAPKPAPRRAAHNPVAEAQLSKIEQEIQEQTAAQKQLEEQISFHSSKLEREPIFEQQMAGLMRDYDTLRAHYNHLLDKKLSADMYTALVSRQEGERFIILDSAQVPSKPFGPNRFLYCLIGFLGGIFAGIGLAVVVEMTDPTVRDEREAATILGKSVMAGIPLIVTDSQAFVKRMRTTGAMAITVICSSGVGLLVSYFMKRAA